MMIIYTECINDAEFLAVKNLIIQIDSNSYVDLWSIHIVLCYEFEQKGAKPPRVAEAIFGLGISENTNYNLLFKIFIIFFVLISSCRPLFQEGKTASLPALGTMTFTSISLLGSCHILSGLRSILKSCLLHGKKHLYALILFFRQERTNTIELEVNNAYDNQRASNDKAYLTPANNGSVHYYSTID